MTTPSLPEGRTFGAPGFDPNRNRRHPLGLPAGSVRALLALMVFGIIWCLLLLPEKPDRDVRVPQYLVYLMFLILGHYFAARGHGATAGPGERHPLYLPRGSLRFIMLAGFAAAMGWGYYHNPNFFDRLKPDIQEQPYLPFLLLAVFFLGIVVGRIGNALLAGPEGLPPWFQDMLAWISLLAVMGLAAEIIVHLVINPTLEHPLNLPHWEGYIASLVGFYFGVKS
jgi:hypothetical protein